MQHAAPFYGRRWPPVEARGARSQALGAPVLSRGRARVAPATRVPPRQTARAARLEGLRRRELLAQVSLGQQEQMQWRRGCRSDEEGSERKRASGKR